MSDDARICAFLPRAPLAAASPPSQEGAATQETADRSNLDPAVNRGEDYFSEIAKALRKMAPQGAPSEDAPSEGNTPRHQGEQLLREEEAERKWIYETLHGIRNEGPRSIDDPRFQKFLYGDRAGERARDFARIVRLMRTAQLGPDR